MEKKALGPWKKQGHLRYHLKLPRDLHHCAFFGVVLFWRNMRKPVALVALLAALAAPIAALADSTVDSSLIPDGTYVVKVDKVVDANHMVIVMQNSVKTQVSAVRPSMDFTKLKTNADVKLSLGKGKVLVFIQN